MTAISIGAWQARAATCLRVAAVAGLGALASTASEAQDARSRDMGSPFRTVFPFVGLSSQWWPAQYDHSGPWQETGWRDWAVQPGEAGLTLLLAPSDPEARVPLEAMNTDGAELIQQGKTAKKFLSGQIQHNKWFGYGRFEVIMTAAAGEGLISAFYVYTGGHFGDSHEEIDIEILGKDATKAQFNRFRDGQQLKDHPWMGLGFDSSQKPHLYAFEWSEDSISWFVDGELLYKYEEAEEIPRPPAKIFVDLWAGGPRHETWSGIAPEETRAEMLVQCVSYSPLEGGTPTCGDLTKER